MQLLPTYDMGLQKHDYTLIEDESQNLIDNTTAYTGILQRLSNFLTKTNLLLLGVLILLATNLVQFFYSNNPAPLVTRLGGLPSKYTSHNTTEANMAWDAIQPGHGIIAVDSEWAAMRNLPSTGPSALDPSKKIYIIEAYHAIHCVVSPGQPLSQQLTLKSTSENAPRTIHGRRIWYSNHSDACSHRTLFRCTTAVRYVYGR